MAQRYDVIVVGDYFLDLVFTGLPGMPELGREIFASGFAMLPGGAYNSALAMHRLGLRVGWAADFGDDEFSSWVLAQARREGLDDRLFGRHARPLRRITVAASLPQDRAFLTYCDPSPTRPAALVGLATNTARVVLLTGLYTGEMFEVGLALMRLKRMKLVMDGNGGEALTLDQPGVRRAIASSAVFLPNAVEARRLTALDDLEAAARALAALGPLVVVKDGPRGALACDGSQIIQAPGLPVEVVDTTGAGDCFNAGFLKAWLDERPLAECLRWGNIVGGLSTTAHGGTGKAVTLDEVRRYLA